MKNLIDKLLNWYFSKKSLPYWCILFIDCAIVGFSVMFVFWMFTRRFYIYFYFNEALSAALLYALLSVIGFRLFRTYSPVMRYASFIDLLKISYGNLINLAVAIVLRLITAHNVNFYPFRLRHLILIFILTTLLMWVVRILIKTLYEVASADRKTMRAFIYGPMEGGVALAKSIRTQRPIRFNLKGFISHDGTLKNHIIMGCKVYEANEHLADIVKERDIKAVLVSPLKIKEFRANENLQDLLIGAGVKIFMAHNLQEWKEGDDISGVQLQEVSVEDLLPRSEIRVDLKSVEELLKDQRVLITGSAGSIGSELVRQVAKFKPAAMMLIDQAETPQHDIRLMMAKDFPDIQSETIVTSISRKSRMEEVFKSFRPDYVFHAAAYKHVPMMEDNPSEAVLNNIYGTKVIADMAVKYGVKKFVMVSTDKAVNPTNVMGCSKRICEIYVQSLDQSIKEQKRRKAEGPAVTTQFVTTRFGNVLGSNGSVIPLFREQIKNGGPVTVTDERIVRFFMLIPEACKLVLEAGTKGNGGEIFVFDMGKPVKIADLAKRMIMLSGATNVEIKYTGLRPGEKLYEEVLNELEGTKPTFHEKIRIAEVREYDYAEVCKQIDDLVEISKKYDDMATVAKMKEIVPEYKSNNSIYESLDK